jgi:hypothetical protein
MSSIGPQVRQLSVADVVDPLGMRRAAAMSSAKARSAVVSVRTPGVLPAGCRVGARVDVDVVEADREVAHDLQLGPARRAARRRPGR